MPSRKMLSLSPVKMVGVDYFQNELSSQTMRRTKRKRRRLLTQPNQKAEIEKQLLSPREFRGRYT